MYKITVKGEAYTDYEHPEELDGIQEDNQDFTEYFSGKYRDNEQQQSLIDKKVCNGYMSFIFKEGKLWTITTYESPEELTERELNILRDYTQGQWSDGIGEGFEQEACYYDSEDNEVYISPWSHEQIITVTQEKIN